MLSLKTKKFFTYIFLSNFFYDYYIYYITFQMANESSPLRLPNESNIEGSKRRIRTRRNWHGQLTMMNSITREAGEQMQAPENRQYHDAFQGINIVLVLNALINELKFKIFGRHFLTQS